MTTERGLDRLTFFTDAIVAIAITLLILPLVERLADAGSETPAEWIGDNLSSMLAFLLTFAVTARFWMVHHQLFGHVVAWSPRLRTLDLAWAFTIVFLSLPSAMLTVWPSTTLVAGLYIGSMLATTALSMTMVLLIRGSALEDPQNPITPRTVRASVVTTAEFAVAFALGQIPAVNFYALLVLLITPLLNPLLAMLDSQRATRA
jgi:uncharacterized membrane protein